MAPSKHFVDVPTRQVRMYKSVSEDRLQLLLDRLRANVTYRIDWVSYISALFSAVVTIYTIYDSWKGTGSQVVLLMMTSVFITALCLRAYDSYNDGKQIQPMSNEDFLNELAEEPNEEIEDQKESINNASVKF